MSALDQIEPIEQASVDELRALQLARLKEAVHHAYEHVPHYRQKFDAAGVHPGDLKSFADLARFPFTSKDDLRQKYPFGMVAVPMDEIVRIHDVPSGTTRCRCRRAYTRPRSACRSFRSMFGRLNRHRLYSLASALSAVEPQLQ